MRTPAGSQAREAGSARCAINEENEKVLEAAAPYITPYSTRCVFLPANAESCFWLPTPFVALMECLLWLITYFATGKSHKAHMRTHTCRQAGRQVCVHTHTQGQEVVITCSEV